MKTITTLLMAILVFAAVFFLFPLLTRLHAEEMPKTDAEMRAFLDRCVNSQHLALGVVVAVVDTNGTRLFSQGVAKAGGPKVNGDTVFEIASVTKTFTALLLQQMVDAGEVRLSDPIGKYLPATVKSPTRDGKEITLLDLATHSSGLPRLPGNLKPKDAANPYADYTVQRLYDCLSHYELQRDIGKRYEYSNLGVGLLGHVLALRAGTNYESLVINRICDPLGMNSTRITLSQELKGRFATAHDKSEDPVEHWDIPTLAGCGALRSTANDLAKYVAANMGLGQSPLSKAMKEAQRPRRSAGRSQKIGLIWMTDTSSHTVWHNGGTFGSSAYIGFKADGSRGVVVLSNSGNGVDELGQLLLGDGGQVEDSPSPSARKVAKVDAKMFDEIAGIYKFSGAPVTITTTHEGERLFVQMTGQDKIEFFPESEARVFCKVVDAQITFEKNASGKVTHLVLHQGGIDQRLTRVK